MWSWGPFCSKLFLSLLLSFCPQLWPWCCSCPVTANSIISAAGCLDTVFTKKANCYQAQCVSCNKPMTHSAKEHSCAWKSHPLCACPRLGQKKLAVFRQSAHFLEDIVQSRQMCSEENEPLARSSFVSRESNYRIVNVYCVKSEGPTEHRWLFIAAWEC